MGILKSKIFQQNEKGRHLDLITDGSIIRQLYSDIATIVHAQHKCLDISIRMAILPASP